MRNQQESAFLRLPGEIRNTIYAYALRRAFDKLSSGLSDAYTGRRLDHRALVSSELGLLIVSHQVHAETRLLPFKLNTFQVPPESLRVFVNKLKNTQRDAIATFRVTREAFAFTGSTTFPLANCRLLETDASSGLFALGRMRGLKRVVVCGSQVSSQGSEWTRRTDKEISAWLRHCVGNREVDIVLEHLT
jgi:hypothetical protein